MGRKKKIIIAISLFFTGLLGLWGCSSPSHHVTDSFQENTETAAMTEENKQTVSSLVYESSMELQYAENFTVDYYEGGYTMLTTTVDGARFFIVPEGK